MKSITAIEGGYGSYAAVPVESRPFQRWIVMVQSEKKKL